MRRIWVIINSTKASSLPCSAGSYGTPRRGSTKQAQYRTRTRNKPAAGAAFQPWREFALRGASQARFRISLGDILSQADPHERADHQPHHLVEKAVALEFNRRCSGPDCAHANAAESSARCRPPACRGWPRSQRNRVGRRKAPARAVSVASSRADRATCQARPFSNGGRHRRSRCGNDKLFLRRKARVKRFGDEPATHDPDLRRQRRRSSAVSHLLRSERRARQIHMGALRERVHAGIRPARAVHSNALSTDTLRMRSRDGPESCCRSPGFASRQTARRHRRRSISAARASTRWSAASIVGARRLVGRLSR